MKRLHLIVITVFLIGLIIVIVSFNIAKKRLLIIHSYDKEYFWTRDVDIGIKRILNSKGEYVIRWFYMDTKRHPWEQYKINSGLAVQKLVNNWHPSVIIAVDDDAQKFAMKFFNNRNDIQIVFAGVNNEAEDYGYDKANNVTGILERLPLTALKETLLEIVEYSKIKYPPRIMFLGDKSTTVVGDEAFFSSFNWEPIQRIESRLVETYDEWKKAVHEATQKTNFIIVSNYRQILRTKNGTELVPPKELINWTEHNSYPAVIGTNVFFASDGGMLAIGTSPYEQGETAAKMAKELLDNEGKLAKSIPIVISKEFVVSMRASRIKAHHIQLSSVYTAAAKSADNYYEGSKEEEFSVPAPVNEATIKTVVDNQIKTDISVIESKTIVNENVKKKKKNRIKKSRKIGTKTKIY